MTGASATFSSRLAPTFAQYVDLKRALGQRFYSTTRLALSDRWTDSCTTKLASTLT